LLRNSDTGQSSQVCRSISLYPVCIVVLFCGYEQYIYEHYFSPPFRGNFPCAAIFINLLQDYYKTVLLASYPRGTRDCLPGGKAAGV